MLWLRGTGQTRGARWGWFGRFVMGRRLSLQWGGGYAGGYVLW